MMSTREPLEWHFKQLDHAVGLSFKTNFHFALVGHLLKGYRHPTPTTVSRTARVLTMLLAIVAKPLRRDKFEVTPDSVAYLAGKTKISLIRIRRSRSVNELKQFPQLSYRYPKRCAADVISDTLSVVR